MIRLWLAALAVAALAGGCWCPCEVHGTTMPLPQQQCAEQPGHAEPGPASQPQKGAARGPGPESQPSK